MLFRSLLIAYSLRTHCLSLPTHCLLIAYSLPTHCLLIAYSLPLIAYSLPTHCLLIVYSLPLIAYSLPTHCLLIASIIAAFTVFFSLSSLFLFFPVIPSSILLILSSNASLLLAFQCCYSCNNAISAITICSPCSVLPFQC